MKRNSEIGRWRRITRRTSLPGMWNVSNLGYLTLYTIWPERTVVEDVWPSYLPNRGQRLFMRVLSAAISSDSHV